MRNDIKPMGAISPKADKLEMAYKSDEWQAEPKMDGSRYIAQVIDGKVFLTSRRESVKGGMVDKTANVPWIIKELCLLANCTLDGEIDNRAGRDFHRVQGIMGSLPEKAIDKQTGDPLVYKVFDILSIGDLDLRTSPLHIRRKYLENIIKDFKYIILVEPIFGEANKRKAFSEAIEAGMEGVILKNKNSLYVEDKKPCNTWYKVKLCNTYEGVVVGYKEGEGKYKGMLGTLTISQYKDDVLTEVAEISGMTDAQRVEFKDRIDKGDLNWVVEFKAQEPEGANCRYRHPRFVRERLDKNPEACKYGEA